MAINTVHERSEPRQRSRGRMLRLRRRDDHIRVAADEPEATTLVTAEPTAHDGQTPPGSDEFVWTPGRRVSVFAALVWLQHGEADEVDVHFNGIQNAACAGLARLEPGNWHVTERGVEVLRDHDLMDTYSVTPRPVAAAGEDDLAEATQEPVLA